MNEEGFSLAEVQGWMQAALIDPYSVSSMAEVVEKIAPSPRLSGPQRLAIYQWGYYARLLECMRGQFKALCHALGTELFEDFAREYLQAHPSVSHTLSALGARFAAYLEAHRPDAALPAAEREPWADFMVDLATFEWDLYEMFDMLGNEGKPLATADAVDKMLALQPAFKLGRYRFPVDAYYRAVRDEASPDFPDPRLTHVAFVRREFQIGVIHLQPPQYFMLRELKSGADVGSALAASANHFGFTTDQAAAAWQRWRTTWIDAGFFVAQTIG